MPATWEIGDWMPDSTHFIAAAALHAKPMEVWVISVAGGAQRKIATGATPWGVSPDGSESSDGKWILFEERDGSNGTTAERLMRMPVGGGMAEEVLRGQYFRVACPRLSGASCVIAEATDDHKRLIFSRPDPLQGRGRALARFVDEHASDYTWDLSPDGTEVVLYSDFASEHSMLSLKNSQIRNVKVSPEIHLRNMTWAADGRGLFAANAQQLGAQLLYLDMQGHSRVLWELPGKDVFLLSRASPDGRHLAIQTSAGTSNMWMVEDL